MKTCSIEGCEKKASAKGWCGTHYMRIRRHGDPEAGARTWNPQMCTAAGCSRKPIAKGLCHGHYSRRRHGRESNEPLRGFYQDKICAAENCQKPRAWWQWCAMHGRRSRLYGDPNIRQVLRGEPEQVRFWALVGAPDEGRGCRLWLGTRARNGYGQWRPRDREPKVLTHRKAWELTFGEIPDGLFVCHHCDTPACCEPSHLFLGTHQDNMRDMVEKGRGRQANVNTGSCSVSDCSRPARCRKLCGTHYSRWRKHGSADVVLPRFPVWERWAA